MSSLYRLELDFLPCFNFMSSTNSSFNTEKENGSYIETSNKMICSETTITKRSQNLPSGIEDILVFRDKNIGVEDVSPFGSYTF